MNKRDLRNKFQQKIRRFGFDKVIWNLGKKKELTSWENHLKLEQYLLIKGLGSHDEFQFRLGESELQQNIKDLLLYFYDDKNEYSILDVGSCGLTTIGRKWAGKKLNIACIDALADEYNKLHKKYGIKQPIIPIQMDAEDMDFDDNSFDLVYCKNALDHFYDPMRALSEMKRVGEKVFIVSKINEGENSGYNGLHQWNIYLENNMVYLSSPYEKHNLGTGKIKDNMIEIII